VVINRPSVTQAKTGGVSEGLPETWMGKGGRPGRKDGPVYGRGGKTRGERKIDDLSDGIRNNGGISKRNKRGERGKTG